LPISGCHVVLFYTSRCLLRCNEQSVRLPPAFQTDDFYAMIVHVLVFKDSRISMICHSRLQKLRDSDGCIMAVTKESEFWKNLQYRPKLRVFRRQQATFPYRPRNMKSPSPRYESTAWQRREVESNQNISEDQRTGETVAIEVKEKATESLCTPYELVSRPEGGESDVNGGKSLTSRLPDSSKLPLDPVHVQLPLFHPPPYEDARSDTATLCVNILPSRCQLKRSWYIHDHPDTMPSTCPCKSCAIALSDFTHGRFEFMFGRDFESHSQRLGRTRLPQTVPRYRGLYHHEIMTDQLEDLKRDIPFLNKPKICATSSYEGLDFTHNVPNNLLAKHSNKYLLDLQQLQVQLPCQRSFDGRKLDQKSIVDAGPREHLRLYNNRWVDIQQSAKKATDTNHLHGLIPWPTKASFFSAYGLYDHPCPFGQFYCFEWPQIFRTKQKLWSWNAHRFYCDGFGLLPIVSHHGESGSEFRFEFACRVTGLEEESTKLRELYDQLKLEQVSLGGKFLC
jgi:hypothetical protein